MVCFLSRRKQKHRATAISHFITVHMAIDERLTLIQTANIDDSAAW